MGADIGADRRWKGEAGAEKRHMGGRFSKTAP